MVFGLNIVVLSPKFLFSYFFHVFFIIHNFPLERTNESKFSLYNSPVQQSIFCAIESPKIQRYSSIGEIILLPIATRYHLVIQHFRPLNT